MRVAFVLCALVLLAAAFAMSAPATLIDRRVAAATADRLRLADATGTVWRGGGILTDAPGRWRVPLSWRVDALPLLHGAFALTLVSPEPGAAQGAVLAEGNTVRVSGLHLELPASAVESMWARPPVPRLDGLLVVDAPAFESDGVRADGSFDVRWSQARVSLAGVGASLGTVEAHARPANDGVAVTLSNDGGDVALRGTVAWTSGTVTVDATLTPAPTLAPATAAALRALGRSDADGTVHLAWQTRR